MTDVARNSAISGFLPNGLKRYELPLGFAAIIIAGVLLAQIWPGATRWPAEWVIPAEQWVTNYINWLKRDLYIFGVAFTDITRFFGSMLKLPIKWAEYLLFRGMKPLGLGPLPWVAVTAGVTLLAHRLGGIRLALLCLISCLYLSFFHLWKDSMKTMAVVLVAVPLSTIIGLVLGIWVTRSRLAAKIITPIFDLMQATPHMAYLAPVAALYAAGSVTALIATVIFAMPPMARCTILGLQTVPSDILESGQMSGCTPRQLLWKVALPSSKRTLMLGLNQVVMQTLAMVVIASIAGQPGLGHKLLYSLQQLKIGLAIEQGIAITLLAIMLDRLTQAYAYRDVDHLAATKSWFERNWYWVAFAVVLVGSYIAAEFFKEVRILPRKATFSFQKEMSQLIRDFNIIAYPILNPMKEWMTTYVFLNIRDFFLWLPWPVFVGVIALGAWRLGRWPVMWLCIALCASFIVTGFWVETMQTTYLVLISGIFCVLIGVPVGVWCSRSERVASITMSICDTLQTFPSFIYLIPAIMLFNVSIFSNVIAIIPYATVPAIRFTYLGLKNIAPVTIEAAKMNGANSWQRLWKVELPIAIPEIMLGLNQTIMMALAMTAITALIGSSDLGQAVVRSISTQNYGRGILAGFFIAALGIIADRLIQSWASKRKKELGFEG